MGTPSTTEAPESPSDMHLAQKEPTAEEDLRANIQPGDNSDDDANVAAQRAADEDDGGSHDEGDDNSQDDEEEDDEEEDDEEPRLKYAYLTKHLNPVYRNRDATSSFVTAGDKMIIGTHNGRLHVLALPSFQSLRVIPAHSASVTSISVSPLSHASSAFKPDYLNRQSEEQGSLRSPSVTSLSLPKSSRQPALPATPSNSIYIASASIDGNVCVASLTDPKDILLRNFGRPVQAVALSPDYKHDKTYLSGGRAGQLVLTVGGRVGARENSTAMGGTAAAASGWLGSLGLGSNTGKDTVLHSGEGAISIIKWSTSGKYVAWVNEEGIKIMRSNLHLESSDSEFAWKRISHVDRPNLPGWEEMAEVWKARAEWVDEGALESDDEFMRSGRNSGDVTASEPSVADSKIEKLVVGWGGTIWVINVNPDGVSAGKQIGSAEVATILRTDCIISGISLYSPRLLLVLAYIQAEDNGSGRRRPKGLKPELRLIDIESKEEISADTLSISNYQNLSSSDYHMSVLSPSRVPIPTSQKGALGALGNGLWDATLYPARLFSSGASIRSSTSAGDRGSIKAPSSFASRRIGGGEIQSKEVQAVAAATGVKVFIHSPYDCVAAVKRGLADHLAWLEEHSQYEQAWDLIDEHPEVATSTGDHEDSAPGTPAGSQTSLVKFFADENASATTVGQATYSVAAKEKRRIGELWVEQCIAANDWKKAGEVCGKVLDTTSRWETWIWTFAKEQKFDEITPHIPVNIRPPLPSLVYEVILGHYVARDRQRFKELIDQWPTEIFDASSVAVAIEEQLKSEDVTSDTEDWQILMECLAKISLAGGHYREALRCYVRLQDADAAMGLIRDYRLVDAISDDISGLILIRVSKEQMRSASIAELEEATSEPIKLLVSEAYTGIVPPETVFTQLKAARQYLYLYFYLRALWRGESLHSENEKPRRGRHARDAADKLAADEGKALIDPFADTAVELFADYDRPLLMGFLQSSTAYSYDAAREICEARSFTPELIYLLSKMGQTKKALNLILSDLKDVSKAIAFAKSQDDPDLWEDLLNYSMDKPRFIHGLLTEAGTSIDPIKLVRRIPSGLEIEGLREGLIRMIREHDIQASISQGAAKVLQGEVAIAMDTLRQGQRRGIKFDIIDEKSTPNGEESQFEAGVDEEKQAKKPKPKPGRCAGCHEAFSVNEKEILVGFACGHVFHVSHLHPETPTGNPEAQTPDATSRPLSPSRPPTADELSSFTTSRTVGPKVITARLLRDKVKDGLPHACGTLYTWGGYAALLLFSIFSKISA
ncbi:hypothetical protein DTO164E3_8778 [Paecilomyces variotii]|nr:hypothetical protein DTO164E3_8778 [Paecilomyces variotii]KAJ9202336.1 hypothetical protein DTO032I3_3589 [Paecilomyces variotii]KAJ9278561.1 hypothetical protein DTO021D3_4470 [Paecilomyces variotii]KAJ9344535.1 hypothetical protein DTO027B6_2717 [Paecilomyces variotii]KAJ9350934.1 hypothetical protein DTO027B9_6679 [Paecilomyces variotii]